MALAIAIIVVLLFVAFVAWPRYCDDVAARGAELEARPFDAGHEQVYGLVDDYLEGRRA